MTREEIASELQRRYRVYLMRGDDPGRVFEFVCQQMEPILAALRAEPDEEEVERGVNALLDADWRGMELGRSAAYRETVASILRAARSRP